MKQKLIVLTGTVGDMLKLLAKNTSSLCGSFLLFLAGAKVAQEDRKKRIVVLFGGGIGDVAKRSVVCEYVKEHLSEYDVYYLMPYDISLPHGTMIHFDYKKAKINPLYYFRLVNKLRKIGFSRAIVLLPAWEGFLSSLGKNILPDVVYRYTETVPPEPIGFTSLLVGAFQPRQRIYRDIPVLSFYDKRWPEKYFPSDLYKIAYFFSQVVCDIEPDEAKNLNEKGLLKPDNLRTEIELVKNDGKFKDLGDYCVIGLGSSFAGKNWSPEKFGQVARLFSERNVKVVLVGGSESANLVEAFKKAYGGEFIDLINKTNLSELTNLINGSVLVLGNDTSFVHLAIALMKPTVCPLYGKSIGADSFYGYEDINQWVFLENFSNIEPREVGEKVEKALAYIKAEGSVPRKKFALSFLENNYVPLMKGDHAQPL